MTTSSNIVISAQAPSYASNSININQTGCGGGLSAPITTGVKYWDGRTYVGDFPPQPQPYDFGPIWIEPHSYPRPPASNPFDEWAGRLKEKLTLPPTKFRVTESGDRILLSLDIPGVRQGGVELTIEGYVVTVKAHRQDLKQKIEETHTLTQECDVDPREIDAWHEDGVITVAFKRMGKGPVKIGVR